MEKILIVWLIWNVITFGMMGVDKYKAKKNKWRIREGLLLGSAFIMGAAGSFAGSRVFHHKTMKMKFKIGLPMALVFNIAAVAAGVYFLL